MHFVLIVNLTNVTNILCVDRDFVLLYEDYSLGILLISVNLVFVTKARVVRNRRVSCGTLND